MSRSAPNPPSPGGSRSDASTRNSSRPLWSRRGVLGLGGGGLLLMGAGGLLSRFPLKGVFTEHPDGSPPSGLQRFTGEREAMGTRAALIVGHDTPEVAHAAMKSAFEAIAAVECRMSRFLLDSDVGRLNHAPGIFQEVHPDTALVLRQALAYARAADGRFDPCLEAPSILWGFLDHNPPATLPTPARLKRLVGNGAWRTLRDESEDMAGGPPHGFRLTRPDVGIDLGGIAKGYAVDRAAEALLAAGIEQAVVNVGDDLRVLGGAPEGGPWRIGVRHPRKPQALLTLLEVRDSAVATSGDYANAFIRDGRRYAHLLDPATGGPARGHRSMTVQAATAMAADTLATAAFTATPAQAPPLLNRLGATSWLGVDAQGTVYRG